MRRIAIGVLAMLLLVVLARPGLTQSTLGPGPKVTVSVLAHPIPTHPQYSKLDLPFFRETLVQRSQGRFEFKTSTWTEMSITGYEIVRMTRQGHPHTPNAPLTPIAQAAPALDPAHLARLTPTPEPAPTPLPPPPPTPPQHPP